MRIVAFGLLCALDGLGSACSQPEATARVDGPVRIANAPPGSFSEGLAHEYERELHRKVEVVSSSQANAIVAMEHGDVDVNFSAADTVYFAYRKSSERGSAVADSLRAIAVLGVMPLHVVVRNTSTARSLSEIGGAVIGVYPNPLMDLVLGAFGIPSRAIRRYPQGGEALAKRFVEGDVDSVFFLSYSPATRVEQAINHGGHLVGVAGPEINKLRRDYRFIKPVAIPAGTYAGQTAAIATIGVDVVYVCRRSLDESLVYALTRQLFRSLPKLSAIANELQLVDVAQAANTPIPLHPGAARYYREDELSR